MPASLLRSQYDTLEPLEPDEPGVEVSVDGTAAEVCTGPWTRCPADPTRVGPQAPDAITTWPAS